VAVISQSSSKEPLGRDPDLDTDAIQGAVSNGPPSHQALAQRIRVLVADDDRVSRSRLAEQVAEWGYDVVQVVDGTTALRAMTAIDGPSLALLDWEMPGLSGIELCRILRTRATGPYVYVIMVTGREGPEHVITALTAGADDFVRKPIEPQELEVRIRAGGRIVELQTQLLKTHKALERRARFDFLTDALNRETILEQMQDELSRSVRSQEPFSIILMDLDHFKQVNDNYGHSVGDSVLKCAVSRAFQTVRPYDAVGRWGGEEFMVLAPGCGLLEGSLIAECLKTALAESPIATAGGSLRVTGSFGVASTEQGYIHLDALIDAADKALYLAKGNGRNRVELADNATGKSYISRHPITQPAPEAPDFATARAEPGNGSHSPPARSPVARRAPLPRWSNLPVFDQGTLTQLGELSSESDSTFLFELFENYLETADQSLSELRTIEDPQTLRRTAHALKGSSLNVGAAGVATLCGEIERGLSEAPGDLELPALLGAIEDQVEQVRERYAGELLNLEQHDS
jgi:diguanylate cyclase (GGDEF)-like protein